MTASSPIRFAPSPHSPPPPLQPPPLKPTEAYKEYRLATLRWSSIYSTLETVYSGLTNPQARMAVREVLELALTRLIVVRGLAAKWHTLPPDLRAGAGGAKPDPKAAPGPVGSNPRTWHFLEWDDLASAPALQPAATQVRAPLFFLDALYVAPALPLPEDMPTLPVAAGGAGAAAAAADTPRSFIVDTAALRTARDALVRSMNTLKLGVPAVAAEIDAIARAAAFALLPARKLDRPAAVAVLHAYWSSREMDVRVDGLRTAAANSAVTLARALARRAADAEKEAAAAANGGDNRENSQAADASQESASEKDENDDVMSREDAAVHVQRAARGYIARSRAMRDRSLECEFLGQRLSAAATARLENLESEAGAMVAQLARERDVGSLALAKALGELPAGVETRGLGGSTARLMGAVASIEAESGTAMRNERASTVNNWIIGYMAANPGKVPDGINAYYADVAEKRKAAADAAADLLSGDAAAAGKGKGAPEKGKDKAKADNPPEEPDFPPVVRAGALWAGGARRALDTYATVWGALPGGGGCAPVLPALTAALVRPSVAAAIARDVDARMDTQCKNIIAAQPKGKKEKKAKAKKVKEKKEKVKALPGDKWWERRLEKRKPTVDDFLSLLAEVRALNAPRSDATFDSFLGLASGVTAARWNSDGPAYRRRCDCVTATTWADCATHGLASGGGVWMPPEPSYAQVREALMMTAVLPLGSAGVREAVDEAAHEARLWRKASPRSILLFGPPGVGKTHLAQAVAIATGALFINLSVGNLEGKFSEKDGAAGMMHAAFLLARDASVGPVVIYIDQVEKMLPLGGGKGKKADAGAGGAGGPGRFKTVLPAYCASLSADLSRTGAVAVPGVGGTRSHHRAIVIGCTSDPDAADPKLLDACFDVSLYVPPPDYGTRLLAWREEMVSRIVTVLDEKAVAAAAAAEEARAAAAAAQAVAAAKAAAAGKGTPVATSNTPSATPLP